MADQPGAPRPRIPVPANPDLPGMPLDLRVNTLKANRDKVARHLVRDGAKPTAIARHGLRIEAGERAARLPNVQASTGFEKGWFEIQDEGSQIVADLIYAQPGEGVWLDCRPEQTWLARGWHDEEDAPGRLPPLAQ